MNELLNTLSAPTLSSRMARQNYSELTARYDEPWRYYHTNKHLVDVTRYLMRHVNELENPRVTLWAAIGHDSIYIPSLTSGQNEELSAQLTESMLQYDLPAKEVSQIGDYIRATEHHLPSDDNDLNLLHDADIKVFGASSEVFREYETNIRKEFSQYSDRDFAMGRKAVLRSFLDKPRIYTTDVAYGEFEEKARQNLKFSIARLNMQLRNTD